MPTALSATYESLMHMLPMPGHASDIAKFADAGYADADAATDIEADHVTAAEGNVSSPQSAGCMRSLSTKSWLGTTRAWRL